MIPWRSNTRPLMNSMRGCLKSVVHAARPRGQYKDALECVRYIGPIDAHAIPSSTTRLLHLDRRVEAGCTVVIEPAQARGMHWTVKGKQDHRLALQQT